MSTPSSKLRRERQQRRQKRQQQRPTQSLAAILLSDILRLVFDHLEEEDTSTLKFDHVQRLKQYASVNRQWRSVAKQQFYRVAFIAVRGPIFDDYGSVTMDATSNIRLIRDVGEVDRVREVQVDMGGGMHLIDNLTDAIEEIGLGEPPWPRVERLQFNMINSYNYTDKYNPATLKRFNDLISRALPSLREIEYMGYCVNTQRRFIPIAQLIEERLYGPTPLRFLTLNADYPLELKGRDQHPVVLERLNMTYTIPITKTNIPTVVANKLVELTLGASYTDYIWDSFVVRGKSGQPEDGLVFSCLQSLSLTFGMSTSLANLMTALSMDDAQGYFESTRFGTPHFPVLTSLSIRHFPKDLNRFLLLFASSPISSLTISGEKIRIPDDLDLSHFNRLRSLSLLHFDNDDGGGDDELGELGSACAALTSIFSTCRPGLQHLKLATSRHGLAGRRLASPKFADSLATLILGGDIRLHEVERLLPLFPKLQKLCVSAAICPLMSSPSMVIKEYRRLNTPHQLAPLNTSLRFLRAEHLNEFELLPKWPGPIHPPPSKTIEESMYRGLLLGLACRLPLLDTLQVNGQSFGAVEKCIHALTKSDIASGHIAHLQRLQLQTKIEID